ncbi:hypothetical protein [Thiothrix nivea]|uniref:Uncharacterized protein n=1 Tax=Thiothrix nivea (strain ATCC 35100 / DSM 5205 / JP2) TaxID=870187 RepID=A0A656H985_THINJ|nr:hypothetical protein [Thiothrix nivea]EIJ33371.1 hypothetical protein Thini_0734 [Thiothrix nivea DSM 5205]
MNTKKDYFYPTQSPKQGNMTMFNDEAALVALEKFSASTVKLHNDLQALYNKFYLLVGRLELLENKKQPPPTKTLPQTQIAKLHDAQVKAAEDFENGVGAYENHRRFS